MLLRHWTCCLLVAVALTPVAATAQVNVDCNSGQSLQDAITGMNPWNANVINVTGTCNETVVVSGFRDLLIKGSGGATIHPPLLLNGQPAYLAMSVVAGSNVRLCGLTLEGARTGLAVTASQVQAGSFCGGGNNYLVVKDGETGIALTENAAFTANLGQGLVVENQAVRGIYVNASRLHLQGYSDLPLTAKTRIRNNGSSPDAP